MEGFEAAEAAGQECFDQRLKPPVEVWVLLFRLSKVFRPSAEAAGRAERWLQPVFGTPLENFDQRLKPPVEPNGGFSRCSESFWEQPLFGILLGTAAVRNPSDVYSSSRPLPMA
jgi:hypothetical protein